MVILTKDKSFYHSFFSLLILLVLQNVLTFSVNLADNIMLGSYSQAALTGAAAVNQIQFILQQLVLGIGEGLVVLASQYWGQKRIEPIKKLLSIGLWGGIIIGGLITLAVSLFPYQILSLFIKNETYIAEGMSYLNIIRFSYLIFAITNILLAGLRSVEIVKIAFYISLSTLLINVSINYTLIYGNFGAPELGTQGAAIGTLIARVVELLIVVCFYLFRDKRLKFRLTEMFHIDKEYVKDFLRISLPVVLCYGMWGLASAVQTGILGNLNDDAVAAQNVAGTLFQILKVISVGAGSASSVIIAKTVGSGNMNNVKEYSRTLQVIYVIIGLFTSAALFLMRIPLLSFYNLTPEALRLANQFLLVLCVTCIGTAYQMPALGGLIRGGGDTKFVMINDLISVWMIVLPISFFAAFYLKASPVIVVACLNSDQIFKCFTAVVKVNRFRWIKVLTRQS